MCYYAKGEQGCTQATLTRQYAAAPLFRGWLLLSQPSFLQKIGSVHPIYTTGIPSRRTNRVGNRTPTTASVCRAGFEPAKPKRVVYSHDALSCLHTDTWMGGASDETGSPQRSRYAAKTCRLQIAYSALGLGSLPSYRLLHPLHSRLRRRGPRWYIKRGRKELNPLLRCWKPVGHHVLVPTLWPRFLWEPYLETRLPEETGLDLSTGDIMRGRQERRDRTRAIPGPVFGRSASHVTKNSTRMSACQGPVEKSSSSQTRHQGW